MMDDCLFECAAACLKVTRAVFACLILGALLALPVAVFEHVHQKTWPHGWHALATWRDTLQALRGSQGVPSKQQLAKRERLSLWHTAAARTQLQCWDHRPHCPRHIHGRLASGCAGPWRHRDADSNESVMLRPAEILPPELSLSIVGNGPLQNASVGALVDSSDAVVRFNDFVTGDDVRTGSRVDVHAMNGKITGGRACRAPINLVLECESEPRRPPEACHVRRTLACVATKESRARLCHGAHVGADASRGFLVLAMLRREPSRVKLFGFNGWGHQRRRDGGKSLGRPSARTRTPGREHRSTWRPFHYVDMEHELLRGATGAQMASLVL